MKMTNISFMNSCLTRDVHHDPETLKKNTKIIPLLVTHNCIDLENDRQKQLAVIEDIYTVQQLKH